MEWNRIFDRMSYHVVYDDTIADALEYASSHGFSGVQIATSVPHLALESMDGEELAKIKKRSTELGIRINLHAPDELTLTHTQHRVNDAIMSYYSGLIGIAQGLGAQIITVHPGALAAYPEDAAPYKKRPEKDTEAYAEIFDDNLKRLAAMAEEKVHICIENLDLEGPTMNALEKHIKNTDLALCWDLPKMYSYNGDDVSVKTETQEFLFRNLKRIRQVHLHSIANGKSHRVIQKGAIDFRQYLSMLKDVDVLDYCIEVRPREKAVESLSNLKKMLLTS